jgi:DNA excision repair protein ERCC-4
VLEEQPKWTVLADVLEEIERDAYLNPSVKDESNRTILIMCSDQQTCRQIREYLQTMHVKVGDTKEDKSAPFDILQEAQNQHSAEFMMRRRLREYLAWKRNFAKVNNNLYGVKPKQKEGAEPQVYCATGSASNHQGRAPPNKRRRVRGGSSTASTTGRAANASVQGDVEQPLQVSSLLEEIQPTGAEGNQKENVVVDDLIDMEDYYELYDMNDLLIIHPYDGDMDEHILEEARPRYIIMYEPDAAFIRRVEVYRSSHTDRNVRVYFMYYGGSVEEQRYLSAVRREKDAFTKLIKEKGVKASVPLSLSVTISNNSHAVNGFDHHPR